jgi:hypothetical protein
MLICRNIGGTAVTDKALENAERKRDSLAAEINSLARRLEELKRDIVILDDWISRWHEFAGRDGAAAVASVSAEPAQTAARLARTTGNPSKENVAAKVKELILERGAPIARNDLFEALESRGIIIRGADPKVVLGTMLWRTEDIIRLRGHGYWLKNRSFEPAGYNPKKPPFEDTMSEHAKGEFEDILT